MQAVVFKSIPLYTSLLAWLILMQNKDLPFCIIFVNFTFASRKNKHLREQDAMSNELCITG